MTTKVYKSANETALLELDQKKLEGKADIHPEGVKAKNQDNTKTKQLATQKNHANDIHTKLSHPVQDRICETTEHLHYSVKGVDRGM